MMHFPVLACCNFQNQADGVHFCNRCKGLMIVHTLDLGEPFCYQNFLIFLGASISRNIFSETPTCIELISSPEEEKLAPKQHSFEDNSSLCPWQLAISAISKHGIKTQDMKLSLNNNFQTTNSHDKRVQYLLFGNQTGFSLDHSDFQSYHLRRRVSVWPKLGDDFVLQVLIIGSKLGSKYRIH